jgi:colanic acid/amylovoran biosynthesis glycosyltransferase
MVERQRRLAFEQAAGLQANGTPAFNAYNGSTQAPLLFFDNRMSGDQQATLQVIADKATYITSGRPLRLAFSGRLERLKGADHLVPVITGLAAKGINFSFDIFGDGVLAGAMQAALNSAGLADRVTFHGPVSFDDVLVPALKQRIDLFVCCHRQADPSCTYIETLACGVPIVGYENAAFEGVLELGQVGEAVPMDKPQLLVNSIIGLNQNRKRLAGMANAAVNVANEHSFNATFSRRINHLKGIAGL